MNLDIRKTFEGLFHPFGIFKYIDSDYRRVSEGGERLVVKDRDIARKSKDFTALAHLQRYEWVINELKMRNVRMLLDIGCGSGYGTAEIAESLQIPFVAGVDISNNAIEWARRQWDLCNLWFKRTDGIRLHFPSNSIDAVVSFDVLEHLTKAEQDKFIQNIARVLKPTGRAYIGCPNANVSLGNNPFHKQELSSNEFLCLSRKYFKSVKPLCQDIVIDGKRKQETWHQCISCIDYVNLNIFEDYCENAFGLLVICAEPKSEVIK